MLNLFKCNCCIQNQIELASNIAYSNYLLGTMRLYFLQSVKFHPWWRCSLSPFSCSSSVFQWDFGRSLKHSFNFMVCSTQASLLKEEEAFSPGLESACGLPLRFLGQGKTVSLPAGGVCWGRVCVTKLRSCKKRSSECAASETAEGNESDLLGDPAATGA